MKKNICLLTYDTISAGQKYSANGLKKIDRRLKDLAKLPLTASEQRQTASQYATKMSIQGIQPKLSAKLNVSNNGFEIVDINGTFILKPQSELYLQLPENEDVSMHLANCIGIEVPVHGLIQSKDNSYTYFIKRFDRISHKQKLAVEDFAQLAGRTRDTKYDFSMEKIIPLIEQHCTFPMIEKTKFLLRTLFNFIIGNEDMHLKNFSLIQRDNKVELAPAYDFLNSTIALKSTTEEIALPLHGKKSNLRRKDFIDYFAYEKLGLNQKTVASLLNQINNQLPFWRQLLEHCFLTDELKQTYSNILKQRLKILEII